MYKLVLSDFALIANLIQQNKAKYDLIYRKDFEMSGSLYPYLTKTLNSIGAYCDSDGYNKSMRLLLGRMQIALFHTNNIILYQDFLRNKDLRGCPGQLWTHHYSGPDCRSSLEHIINTINNASDSASKRCPSNRVTKTEMGMHWAWGKKCLNEYNSVLCNAIHDLFDMTNRVNKSLDPELIFDYNKALGKINDINLVYEMKERVIALFTSYSHHQINKLGVAKFFTNLKFSANNKVYDRIFWNLDRYAFSYLTSKIDTMDENIQRMFGDAFRILEALMPYCNDDDTEQRIRNLSLWRHPLARLDVQDILSFKYTSDESWESWSLALSFKEMMGTKLGAKLSTDIVKSYSGVLRRQILQIKSEMMKSVSQINSAIGLLADDLKAFQKDNTINSDFILWVVFL